MPSTIVQRYDSFKDRNINKNNIIEYVQFAGMDLFHNKEANKDIGTLVFDILYLYEGGTGVGRLLIPNKFEDEETYDGWNDNGYDELPLIGLGNANRLLANEFIVATCFHKLTNNNYCIYAENRINREIMEFIFEADFFVYLQSILYKFYLGEELNYDTSCDLLKMRTENNVPPKVKILSNSNYSFEVTDLFVDLPFKSILKRDIEIIAKVKVTPLDKDGKKIELDRFFIMLYMQDKKKNIVHKERLKYVDLLEVADSLMTDTEKVYSVLDNTNVDYSINADVPMTRRCIIGQTLTGPTYAIFSFSADDYRLFNEIIYNTIF